jgi:hypothetical protein
MMSVKNQKIYHYYPVKINVYPSLRLAGATRKVLRRDCPDFYQEDLVL